MAGRTVAIAGIRVQELEAVRRLIALLRHDDPRIRELTRQALGYVQDTARKKPVRDAG